MNAHDFSFKSMMMPAYDEWADTAAYWPFRIVDITAFERLMSAKRLAFELRSQCDAEDQASVGDDDMIGNLEINPAIILPFCPVQLALRWTPFALACDLFGPPDACEISKEKMPAAFAAWLKPPTVYRLPKLPVFGARFEKRFVRLAEYLIKSGSPFGIAAIVGYSYESRKLPRVVRAAMKSHGFAFTSR